MDARPDSRWIPTLSLTVLLLLPADRLAAGDWPNWRGPQHTGISDETGWRSAFPGDGPAVLWRAKVGTGYAAVSVAQGRAFTVGHQAEKDTVYAFDAVTGKELWTHTYPHPLDDKYYEGGPSATPTVDGDQVYTLSKRGHLHCFEAATGQVKWMKNVGTELGAGIPTWGFAGSVLIDGPRAVLNVGSHGAAFDKRTGALLWKSGTAASGYATPVPFDHQGERLYLIFAAKELAGVRAADGRKVWAFDWETSHDVNAADPIPAGPNRVFITSGYNEGAALIEIRGNTPTAVWKNKNLRGQLNAPILIEGHLYGFDGDTGNAQLRCVELATGKVKWSFRDTRVGGLTAANGKLIVIGERGELFIGDASPAGFRPVTRAQVSGGKFWTVPVLAHGRLYIRNSDGLITCLDLREGT